MSLSNVTTPPMLTHLLRLHDNKNAQPCSAFNLEVIWAQVLRTE